jgi:hypothetical protein
VTACAAAYARDIHLIASSLRIPGLFKFRAELADLGGDAKAGKRRAANIYSTISLVSIAVARRAGDHEGLMALLRH